MNQILNIYKPRILICPLDWGLGHATRCIPIIKELVSLNCEVIIAADKLTFSLLKKEFPGLQFLSLHGYHIEYSQNKKALPFKIVTQVPKLLLRIRMEYTWLKKTIKEHKINAVISDNRFGLYSNKVPCVYITHQLAIQTGTVIGDFMAQKIHYYFIKKYQKCWIPDFENNGLAGRLSHPKKLPENATYIGALSRFEILPETKKIYDVLVLISGPEPQRTIFENMILSSVKYLTGNILIARGLPSATSSIAATNENVKIENHMDATSLNKVLQQSKLVISRSGYTTVMDLIKLRSKAILVPTPGQTEQEYLAAYLLSKEYFYSVSQEKFLLKKVLDDAAKFAYKNPVDFKEMYKDIIKDWVLSVKVQTEKKTKF